MAVTPGYATKPPGGVGPQLQPGHEKTSGQCWWAGLQPAGWWVLNKGAKRCLLTHTFGDPEPDPEAEQW